MHNAIIKWTNITFVESGYDQSWCEIFSYKCLKLLTITLSIQEETIFHHTCYYRWFFFYQQMLVVNFLLVTKI